MKHKIIIYDRQDKGSELFCVFPERRKDPKRSKGKFTIIKWLKSVFGEEWFEENEYFIGIHTDKEDR